MAISIRRTIHAECPILNSRFTELGVKPFPVNAANEEKQKAKKEVLHDSSDAGGGESGISQSKEL